MSRQSNGIEEMDMPNSSEFQAEVGAETDRRDAKRLRTVCRIAKILRFDDAGLWMVRNISDGGLMLTTNEPVTLGENITIMLGEQITVEGKVSWVEGGKCGVTFLEEIDGEQVLRALAEETTSGKHRPLRVEIETDALVRLDYRLKPVQLVDLSQHGAGIVHDGSVDVGMRLELLLGGGIRREAIVRWSHANRAGLWLTSPLERAQLESIRHLQLPRPPVAKAKLQVRR